MKLESFHRGTAGSSVRSAIAGLATCVGTLGGMSSSAMAQSLISLPVPPGYRSVTGAAISEDGSVVAGTMTDGNGRERPFRWTTVSGFHDLGLLPDTDAAGAAAMSQDGSVVVGTCRAPSGPPQRAFRWTSATGMQPLPDLYEGGESWVLDMSADGTVIVGASRLVGSDLPQAACRWTQNGTVVESLGVLQEGDGGVAFGTSADGSVIVGTAVGPGITRAFRWTAADGMEDLGLLPEATIGFAVDVSGDGSVVVGNNQADATGYYRGFRWTREAGLHDLGLLPEGTYSDAYLTDGDGSIIFGWADIAGVGSFPVVWQAEMGPSYLLTYLESRGFDLSEWVLGSARDVSADGLVIMGAGSREGRSTTWVVDMRCLGADFNHDAMVNSQDFFDFLIPFFASDPAADFNGDGSINSQDFFDYLDVFFTPCP